MRERTSVFGRGHMRGEESSLGAPGFVPLCVYNRLFGEASQAVSSSIQAELTRLRLTLA